MHPWEDWAETWSAYLSVMSTLELVTHHDVFRAPPTGGNTMSEAMDEYVRLCIAFNEINRNRGLIAAFPDILTDRVREKIAVVHAMVQAIATGTASSATTIELRE